MSKILFACSVGGCCSVVPVVLNDFEFMSCSLGGRLWGVCVAGVINVIRIVRMTSMLAVVRCTLGLLVFLFVGVSARVCVSVSSFFVGSAVACSFFLSS